MTGRNVITSLEDVQRTFSDALREGATLTDAVRELQPTAAQDDAAARLDVYRNNAWQAFRGALEATFPVVQKRVGDAFMAQLAHEYRAAHPSQRGDLHEVGRAFPGWLAGRLHDSGYEWLADLARLEWACAEAVVSPERPALGTASLAAVDPQRLEATRLEWQPSLQLVHSRWPIWSVWQANQGDSPGAPVALDAGAEHCAIACLGDRVIVHRLEPALYELLAALQHGASFAEAISRTDGDPATFARLLSWAFEQGLVVAVG